MSFNILKLVLPLISIFIIAACDKEVGESGVVEDLITGERLEGVIVSMSSEQGNRDYVTDRNGYFQVVKTFSCGLASCNDNFKITFTKSNYNHSLINENYRSSAEFVNEEQKDTLIVKLNPEN